MSSHGDDTRPTSTDLDLSEDPELTAIPDPDEIYGTPNASDLTDPDTAGELDTDQDIDIVDEDDRVDGDGDAA